MKKSKVTSTQLLLRGAEILSTPSGQYEHSWTRQVMARDKSGKPTAPESQSACRFCSLGVVYRAAHELSADLNAREEAIRRLAALVGYGDGNHGSVAGINDNPATTLDKVLNIFTIASVIPAKALK